MKWAGKTSPQEERVIEISEHEIKPLFPTNVYPHQQKKTCFPFYSI
jgi:hypothetical protein